MVLRVDLAASKYWICEGSEVDISTLGLVQSNAVKIVHLRYTHAGVTN
jgi:hypothetical protein